MTDPVAIERRVDHGGIHRWPGRRFGREGIGPDQVAGDAEKRRATDNGRERDGEKEDADKGRPGNRDHRTVPERPFADLEYGLDDDGEHGGFDAEEKTLDEADILITGVEDAENQDDSSARQDEQNTRHQSAQCPVQQPADIGRKLLRLGSRQQHAVVQRVQEPGLADPPLLVDQDAVHHRDLAGRSAETEQRDPKPDAECLTERDVSICVVAHAATVSPPASTYPSKPPSRNRASIPRARR